MGTRVSPLRKFGGRLLSGFDRGRHREELLLQLIGQLARVAEEMHRANVVQAQRVALDQMDRAIDDPTLAAALSTLPSLTVQKRRQMLFVNREYAVVLLAHRVGMLTWNEMLGQLRVLCRNDLFREYWGRTVDHRRSYPESSLEGRAGQMVDAMLEELADEPEEWWVVGFQDAPNS
ncbi:DUF6082 family protein [Streptomyces sp. HUAS MG91]|uniref:DUF6082 family protein n=1 Tax=Streptomyces tabacisoli TaxID=3156398 RepID=A0AAU8IVD0_9ACTN